MGAKTSAEAGWPHAPDPAARRLDREGSGSREEGRGSRAKGHLRVAAHITGEAGCAELQAALTRGAGPRGNLGRVRPDAAGLAHHSDDALASLAFDSPLRYETDTDLRAAALAGPRAAWAPDRPGRNPLSRRRATAAAGVGRVPAQRGRAEARHATIGVVRCQS